jgi:toxin YoeB
MSALSPRPLGRPLGPGIWSRCLTQEHRVIYLVEKEAMHFLKARYHY